MLVIKAGILVEIIPKIPLHFTPVHIIVVCCYSDTAHLFVTYSLPRCSVLLDSGIPI